MLDLSSHCNTKIVSQLPNCPRHRRLTRQAEQKYPVDHQDGPEHGDVEDSEPAADKGNGNGAGGGVPELELRQTADERTELVVLLGGQAGGGVAVLQTLVLREGGVELGLQEEEEEVQEVDAKSVGDYFWFTVSLVRGWVLSGCSRH